MSFCELCGEYTHTIVNVAFSATSVCDRCCLAITRQTIASLTVHEFSRDDDEYTEIRSRTSQETT